VPPDLADRAAYDDVVDELRTGGAIGDATHLYWYLRPSDRWPTLEFRAMDVALDIDTAVAVAGLSRALVRTEIDAAERGVPGLDVTPEMVAAALWRAARHGLHEQLVSPGAGEPRPASTVVGELLDVDADALDDAGDRAEVIALVAGILERGNGADRQRAAVAVDGGLEGVVAMARGSLAVAD
jgi:carboxylate-amine ligase